jgi:hypothetical protein
VQDAVGLSVGINGRGSIVWIEFQLFREPTVLCVQTRRIRSVDIELVGGEPYIVKASSALKDSERIPVPTNGNDFATCEFHRASDSTDVLVFRRQTEHVVRGSSC